jgi:hypothetical protein
MSNNKRKKYDKIVTFSATTEDRYTLDKLKNIGISLSSFIREAITEKIKKDKIDLEGENEESID